MWIRLRTLFFFVIITLIGTGWSFFKPFLSDRDKTIIMIVVPLQVLDNVAMVITDATSPGSIGWLAWVSNVICDMSHVTCAIMRILLLSLTASLERCFPISGYHLLRCYPNSHHLVHQTFTRGITNWRERYAPRKYTQSVSVLTWLFHFTAARNLRKLRLFRQFYLIVVSYIYFTRIIIYLLDATLQYNLFYLGDVFTELATLSFFIVVGHKFRPAEGNPYFNLEEEDAARLEEMRAAEED